MRPRPRPILISAFAGLGVFFSFGACGEDSDDDVAGRQSVDAFISIEDGQPGDPGSWELAITLGWQKERTDKEIERRFESPMMDEATAGPLERLTMDSELPETRTVFEDIFEAEYEMKYTGEGSTFRDNMKLSLTQGAEIGSGRVDGNGDTELNWQQRWHVEAGKVPTLATLFSVRLPTGNGSTGVDATLTGILDKDLGPGTVYLSAWGTVPLDVEDDALRDFIWGTQLGYKWRVSERFAMYGNYVFKGSEEFGQKESSILELAAQYEVNDRLVLGPGILVGLDNRDETPEFGAGLKITVGF